MQQAQQEFSWSGDVEQAFTDGRLYVEIDEPRSISPHLAFVNRPAKWDGRGSLVHVISRPAGGEIRGYVLIEGKLHMRLPNHAGDWPELDAAVARRVSAKGCGFGVDGADCYTCETSKVVKP
jgi:hypothetical protein